MDPIKCANDGDVEFFKAAELDVIQKWRDHDRGSSVLALAARMGHLNCFRVIYQRCPQLLYEVDRFGNTPLHEAAKAKRPEIIKCLLYDPLLEALEAGVEEFFEMKERNLSAHSKLFMMQGRMQYTALHYATIHGCLESVQWLASADPSRRLLMAVDANKRTALHAAAERGHEDIVNALISPKDMIYSKSELMDRLKYKWEMHNKSTSKREISDSAGVELKMELSSTGQEEYVKYVKDMLLMVDNEACTALHHAVENGFEDIAEDLVNQARNVRHTLLTAQNHKGKTAIQIAMEKNLLSFMDYLLRNERILTIKQALSCDRISVDFWRLLGKYMSSELPQALLNYVSHKENLNALADTIQNWPECLECVDSQGQNILHLATKDGQESVVKLILGPPERDRKILNMQDFLGNTPLHIAASGGNPSIIYSLLYDDRVYKFILNIQGKSALDAINFEYDKRRAGVLGLTERVDEKDLKDRSDFDLLVGALISTLSFTAGIAVPGGYFSEGPNQGNAVLHKKISFHVFVISNTIALVLSLSAVFSHFCTRRLINEKSISYQLEVATYCSLGAIFAMVVAFMAGSYTVLAVSHWLDIVVCVICCGFFGITIPALRRMVREQGQRRPSHHNSV